MARLLRGLCFLGSAVLALLSTADAFYLPGAAPRDYQSGEKVALLVNALTPMIAGYDNAKLVCSPRSPLTAIPYSRAVVGAQKSLINCTPNVHLEQLLRLMLHSR